MSTKPPDQTRPGEDSLGRFANNADHSSQYRVYLRARLHYLPFLSNAALANVLEKTCQIDPSTLSRGAQEESVRAYANETHLRLIDEDWQLRLSRAQSEQEKAVILHETTSAPPFQNEEVLKRKTPVEWSDETLESLVMHPTRRQPSMSRPATPPVTKNDLPVKGFPAVLQQISNELEKDDTLKTQLVGLLQNLLSGVQPPKKLLQETLNVLTSSKNSMHGLKLGLDLSIETMKAHGTPCVQSSLPPRARENPRPSYASIARAHVPEPVRAPPRRPTARNELAAMRHAIRDDARSVKLRSVKADGARPPGIIANAIAKLIDVSMPTNKIVEDVRCDSRGTTYVQLFTEGFETRLKTLLNKTDSNQVIDLGDAGYYTMSEPTKCEVAGMAPIVISGVKSSHSPAQIATEIWEMNATRWGLSNERCAQHIAGISRLNRRVRPRDGEDKSPNPTWVPSKSIKMFVSRDLLRAMATPEERYLIRYEYEFLEGRPFNKPLRVCENCGTLAEHDARACRRPPRCNICHGNHRSADCKRNIPFAPNMPSGSVRDTPRSKARSPLLTKTSGERREALVHDTPSDYGRHNTDDMCIDSKPQDE